LKKRNKKIEILNDRLNKYAKLMGIIKCEIPKLTFFGEDFKALTKDANLRHFGVIGRRGGKHTTFLGLCSFTSRVIFVNIRGKQTLNDLDNTLIHELIHYQFGYINHPDFHKRIKLIKSGKNYKLKHVDYPKLPHK
jgi:hypothetical protein